MNYYYITRANLMCGIAGIFDTAGRRAINTDILHNMTRYLTHRGRDGHGFFVDNGIGFGHRRLSIIDPADGQQPMVSSCGLFHITFNGMIYNYKNLRQKLRQAGHEFKTQCDTEVLLYAYKAYGTDVCKYLDGFYAFVIYDVQKEMIFAATDSVGKKPFYYHTDNNGFFYFASELPSLIQSFDKVPNISARAIENYMAVGFVPAPKTIFDNVHKLPPSTAIIYKRGHDIKTIDISVKHPKTTLNISYDDACEQVKTLLYGAVEKRLISDMPVGVLLSGGVDSAIVTAIASDITHAQGGQIQTFTAGFKQAKYDERAYAARLAKHFKTKHTELLIDMPDESMIDDIAVVSGEPFADASLIPTYLICKSAQHHVRVLLSGDGADEVFFGYARYKSFAFQEYLKHHLSLDTRQYLFQKLADTYPQNNYVPKFLRFGAMLECLVQDRAGGYLRNFCITRSKIKNNLYSTDFKKILNGYDTSDIIRDLLLSENPVKTTDFSDEFLRDIQNVDMRLWLNGRMLVKSDRASMSAHTELRSPFLDSDVMKYASSLPMEYFTDTQYSKRILRDIISPRLPDGYLNRPKKGFDFPLSDMLRGVWANRLQAVIYDGGLDKYGVFDMPYLRVLLRQHNKKTHDHSRILWAILQFDAFFNWVTHFRD